MKLTKFSAKYASKSLGLLAVIVFAVGKFPLGEPQFPSSLRKE